MAPFKLKYSSLLETTMLKSFKNSSVRLLHCQIITKYTTIRLNDQDQGQQRIVTSFDSSTFKLYLYNTVSSIIFYYEALLVNKCQLYIAEQQFLKTARYVLKYFLSCTFITQ